MEKKDRIKRKTIIWKIEKGETVIVDLPLKFQALNAAWIPRLLRNKGRSILGKHLDHLLKCNNIGFKYMLKINVLIFFMHFIQCRFLFFNQQCTIENKKCKFYHDLPLCRKFELYKKVYDIYFLKILDIYIFKKNN